MSTELMTLAEVRNLAPGTKDNPVWIDGGFSGVCQKVALKTYGEGKKMWPCVFTDESGQNAVEVTFFTAPKFKEGDNVRFSGKGMRRTQYNESAQVAISKDTKVEVSAGTAAITAAAHGAIAEKQNGEMVSGASVGMALKLALELLTHQMPVQERTEQFTAPGFWRKVHVLASDIIRVARLLERGTLADPVSTRGGQRQLQGTPHQPPARPQHNPEAELDEQPPF